MRETIVKHIPLFATNITEVYIDPSLYNKEEIVKTVYENYKKEPHRNLWDNTSDLHHHYNDWNNSKFSQPNLSKIKEVYNDVFNKFINSVSFEQNSFLRCKWNITNITAYNQEQFMSMHDHLLDDCIYSVVHYISLSDNHSPIVFKNPLLALQYKHPIIENYSKCLNSQDLQNSTYFDTWSIKPKEDSMIIFPSYLKHEVRKSTSNKKDTSLRIAIVTNINLV